MRDLREWNGIPGDNAKASKSGFAQCRRRRLPVERVGDGAAFTPACIGTLNFRMNGACVR